MLIQMITAIAIIMLGTLRLAILASQHAERDRALAVARISRKVQG